MGKRTDGYYPTDPHAAVALRRFLTAYYPGLVDGSWGPVLDACAGFGGLLRHLTAKPHRRAIEANPHLGDELRKRVEPEHVVIGDGLDLSLWDSDATLVALNPPHDTNTQTAFAVSALSYRAEWSDEVGVAVLALTSWTRSQTAHKALSRFVAPDYCLAPTFRLSCDGSGRGDSRTHDWLVWLPKSMRRRPAGQTLFVPLPKPALSRDILVEHERLASCPPIGV